MLYYNLSSYLRERFNGKVVKICIDGGFSCPNRDGKCGYGGCIFCGERGAGDHITRGNLSIQSQVKNFLAKPQKADYFIAYFQNFTNTYAPVKILEEKYNQALIDDRIVVLSIGTRPDCINAEIAQLLAKFNEKIEVWVELGLQTSNDKTAEFINRGYKAEIYSNAVKLLNKYGIKTVTHLIVGLPNESIEDIKDTVKFINKHPIWGIKIHCLYIMKGTTLAELYYNNEFIPQSLEEYVNGASYILTHIKRDTVVHRITGDCPKGLLVAPEWNLNKTQIINTINSNLSRNNWYQGCLYNEVK